MEKTPPSNRDEKQLAAEEIAGLMKTIPKWEIAGSTIHRQFRFDDFIKSIAFVTCVATLAERANHHPEIHISYNQVTLTLTTHKAGGLTGKDFSLAEKIDQLIGPRTGD